MLAQEATNFVQELQEQLSLYSEIIALNREQFEILDQGVTADTDAMVAFVGKKQEAMQRLDGLEQTIAPKKARWLETREKADEALRQSIDGLLADLASTIKTLIEMEDEAQQRLESLMTQNTASVESIRKKSQVNKAYAAYGAKKPKPRYVDQRAQDE